MQVKPSSRQALKLAFFTAGLVPITVLVVVGCARQPANRELELQRLPTANLQQLEARPDADVLVHFLYARRLFETNESSQAVAPMARAMAALPNPPKSDLAGRIFALAGCIAADGGADSQAEAMLQRAEPLRPQDVLIYIGRGTLAMRREQPADAVEKLTAATRADPAYAEAWKRLGKAYLQGAEPDLGVQALRRASELNPKDPLIHADLGQGLLQLKQFAVAQTEYETAAALLPDDPYYSTMPVRIVALRARTDTDYAHAADLLNAALTRFPGDDGLRAELAGLEMRFNQFKLARQELETIVSHNPLISADCWYNLSMVCKRLGDSRAAEDARGRSLQLTAMKDTAAQLTEQAQLHPNDARLFFRLSLALLQLRQIDKAYAALRRAATLAPYDGEIAQAMAGAQEMLRSQQRSASGSGAGMGPQ